MFIWPFRLFFDNTQVVRPRRTEAYRWHIFFIPFHLCSSFSMIKRKFNLPFPNICCTLADRIIYLFLLKLQPGADDMNVWYIITQKECSMTYILRRSVTNKGHGQSHLTMKSDTSRRRKATFVKTATLSFVNFTSTTFGWQAGITVSICILFISFELFGQDCDIFFADGDVVIICQWLFSVTNSL